MGLDASWSGTYAPIIDPSAGIFGAEPVRNAMDTSMDMDGVFTDQFYCPSNGEYLGFLHADS